MKKDLQQVSVPIRGLFNLTKLYYDMSDDEIARVSVPIRGLFNLTRGDEKCKRQKLYCTFPSPSGDYLI